MGFFRGTSTFEVFVALAVVATTFFNPFEPTIGIARLVGVVLVQTGVHSCLAAVSVEYFAETAVGKIALPVAVGMGAAAGLGRAVVAGAAAEAICEAVRRPTMRFVTIKSTQQQGRLMLHRVRDLLMRQRTQVILIAYAKSNPGRLSIAFDNTAGAAAFGAKLFNKRAGLDLIEVPYRSGAQMIQDVASGVNQVMMSSIAAANAVVQAGKVRRLAVTSGKRFPGLPELPSLRETIPDMVMDGFFAIVAPAGTPARCYRAAQSRHRAVPQGSRNPGTVVGSRARDRGRRHARKYRANHPSGARPVASARRSLTSSCALTTPSSIRAREARRHDRKTRRLLTNRPCSSFVYEESASKERLRVSNWIVQELYDYAVNETVEL